jgi:hypothetical protein
MRIKIVIIYIFFCFSSQAQKRIQFKELLTFAYQQDGVTKEFSAYVDRKTGTWLLTKDDSFNGSVEDIDQWILKPNGDIIIIGVDHLGNRVKTVVKNNAFNFGTKTLKAKATTKTKVFGENKYGWPTIKGTEYKATTGRLNSRFYAALTRYNCRPLLAFNACVDIENHLPGFGGLEYYKILPSRYLLLEDDRVRLVSISDSDYSVEL